MACSNARPAFYTQAVLDPVLSSDTHWSRSQQGWEEEHVAWQWWYFGTESGESGMQWDVMLLPPGPRQVPPCFPRCLGWTRSVQTASQAMTDLDLGSNRSILCSFLGQTSCLHLLLLSLMPCLHGSLSHPHPCSCSHFHASPSHPQPRRWDTRVPRLGQGPFCTPNRRPSAGWSGRCSGPKEEGASAVQ